MSCQERSGFLFAHDCRLPPVHRCGSCGKSTCERHAHMFEGSVVCTTCAKKAVGARRGQVRDARQHPYDDEWTTHPYFYGAYHYAGYGDYDELGWGDPDELWSSDGGSVRGGRGAGWENDPGGS